MTQLTVGRDEAGQLIQEQVSKGLEMLTAPVGSENELDWERSRFYNWDEFNTALLRKVFTTPDEAEAYSHSGLACISRIHR